MVLGRIGDSRETEIAYLQITIGVQQEIARLQISMKTRRESTACDEGEKTYTLAEWMYFKPRRI